MTLLHLIRRSLRFHWRSHLGVVLGAWVGSAALIGALVVGDSIRESLLDHARARLGEVEFAVDAGDRLFTTDLRQAHPSRATNAGVSASGPLFSWNNSLRSPTSSSVLQLRGTATREDGTARALEVRILGITPNFWGFSARETALRARTRTPWSTIDDNQAYRQATDVADQQPAPGWVRLNRALAAQLKARRGDTLILRFPKPSALSPDAVLSPQNESGTALRVTVDDVVDAAGGGDFGLTAGARPTLNAFLSIDELWRVSGLTNRANLLVAQGGVLTHPTGNWRNRLHLYLGSKPRWLSPSVASGLYPITARLAAGPAPSALSQRELDTFLDGNWSLDDAQISVRIVAPQPAADVRAPSQPQAGLPTEDQATGFPKGRVEGPPPSSPMIEITTPRIFLDRPVVAAAQRTAQSGITKGIPIVTYLANSLRHGDKLAPYSMVTGAGAPWTPADMADDEIVVNDWLADDLGVKRGDRVELAYFDPEAGARLVERTNSFTVRDVVPLRGWHADRSLMPEFPGLAKAESTRDWDAGFPLRHKIRPQDEAYWKKFRGTPKAFVTSKAGLQMWANRFGEFTAVRFPLGPGENAEALREKVAGHLRAGLRPDDVGLMFQPVREQALRAATSGQDFGGLFIGFSFFLVLAALLLMALLFQFGLEQRLVEVGTLLAIGFRPAVVRRLWMGEALALASMGAAGGMAGGTAYARAIIHGLTTRWRDAIGGAALDFHATASSLALGFALSVLACTLAIFLTLRRQFRRPARELLAGGIDAPTRHPRSRALWIGATSTLGALGLTAWTLGSGDTTNAENFFSAGSLLLIGGLGLATAWLGRQGSRSRAEGQLPTRLSLALRGIARRRSRSLATAALLASGTFLVTSLGVFHIDARHGAWERGSGTGGFACVGESSLPVTQDLDTPAGLESFGLSAQETAGAHVVSFRLRDGDDASCLNLNRAQRPRILGVDPAQLARRGAFTFTQVAKNLAVTNGWDALRSRGNSASTTDGVLEIPAIGDAASIQWALGKKIGDTLEMTDERGRPFRLRLVGAVANSILQGNLIIDETAFNQLFPGNGGYRWFLVDAPPSKVDELSSLLTRALQNNGLALTPAAVRLDQFNAVQNTYLSTFQVLGGLGLLLGSAGLGVVVLRNVLERRPELALLSAVGFRRLQLQSSILLEHALLLAAGLGIGLASAAIAVLPALMASDGSLPFRSLAWTLGGVVLLGLGTTWTATRASLRAPLLPALRGE